MTHRYTNTKPGTDAAYDVHVEMSIQAGINRTQILTNLQYESDEDSPPNRQEVASYSKTGGTVDFHSLKITILAITMQIITLSK